jgi:DNA-binding response OmpR family regulator
MQAQAAQKKVRALILEDDIELSTVMEQVLKKVAPNLSLDWVTSAEEAMTRLDDVLSRKTESPYQLIVADIFLDGESTGIDFWRSCQEILPGTPVLITSALSLDRFFATVGQESISPPYLQKPFTPLECKQVFESLLRSRPHWEWNPELWDSLEWEN